MPSERSPTGSSFQGNVSNLVRVLPAPLDTEEHAVDVAVVDRANLVQPCAESSDERFGERPSLLDLEDVLADDLADFVVEVSEPFPHGLIPAGCPVEYAAELWGGLCHPRIVYRKWYISQASPGTSLLLDVGALRELEVAAAKCCDGGPPSGPSPDRFTPSQSLRQ